jgi:hypothetical protein
MEALALPSLGMPEHSFTLILDGSPTPEHTSDIFRTVVQRDAAWQDALNYSYFGLRKRRLLYTCQGQERSLGRPPQKD